MTTEVLTVFFAVIWAVTVAAIVLKIRRRRASGDRIASRWWTGAVAAIVLVVGVLGMTPTRGSAGFALFALLTFALVVALAFAWIARHPSSTPSEKWAAAYGVPISEVNREFISAYVIEGHRLRLICGFGGPVALSALSRGLGVSLPNPMGWTWLMLGYLVGVIWSQGWLTRLPDGATRAASLTPRRLDEYLVGRLRVVQMVMPVVAMGVGLVALLVDARPPSDPFFLTMSVLDARASALGIGLGAAVLVGGVFMLQRRIITKSRPDGDPELLAADDAVRASAVHLLSGTTIGIVLIGIGAQLQALINLGLVGNSFASTAAMALWVAAFIAWRYYGHRAWVVHRPGDATPWTRLEEVRS